MRFQQKKNAAKNRAVLMYSTAVVRIRLSTTHLK